MTSATADSSDAFDKSRMRGSLCLRGGAFPSTLGAGGGDAGLVMTGLSGSGAASGSAVWPFFDLDAGEATGTSFGVGAASGGVFGSFGSGDFASVVCAMSVSTPRAGYEDSAYLVS